MDRSLRILLLVGALFTLATICHGVRKKRIQIEDSLFWVVFAGLLVVIALFPRLVYAAAHALGFQSPSNFAFLSVIAVLLIKEFRNSSKISVLKYRVNQLAQEIALDKNAADKNARKDED